MGHENWIGDSDQFSFIEANIPGLYFGVEDAAQHHKATDDFETITQRFYIASVETIIQVIEEIDRHLDAIVRRSGS
jgi:hypothetical protein